MIGSAAECQFWEKNIPPSRCQGSEQGISGFLQPTYRIRDGVQANTTPFQRQDTSIPPFHSLPVDLLITIFHYANDPSSYPPRATTLMPLLPLMRLSHVCRPWRHIISTSIPTYWSNISVYFPEERHAPLVELWLIRTGDVCPLSLAFYQRAEDDLSLEEYSSTVEIFRLFILYVDRWQSIRFYLQNESPREPLLSLPIPRNLESATLWLSQWELASQYKVWNAINASPNLRKVDWRNLPPPESTPWGQIKDVTSRSETVQFLAHYLSRLQQLEILRANARIPTSDLAVDNTLIPLPSLRTLDLSGHGSLVLLHHVVAPMLEDVKIRSGSGVLKTRSLSDMVARSGCSLVALDIKDRKLETTHLIDFLQESGQYLAGLRHLELQDMRITDDFVNLLIVRDEDEDDCDALTRRRREVYLPALRYLSLHRCITTVDGLVSSMVKSRFRYGLQYAELHLRSELHKHEQDIATFRLLEDEGRQITWRKQGSEAVNVLI